MLKYTRKQINKNVSLHNKEFITYDDAVDLLEKVTAAAIKAGANEQGMMEFLKGDDE